MKRIITVAISKGGCTKTTTAVNLAAGLREKGNNVLLIDMDMQGNASTLYGIKLPDRSLYDVVIREKSIYDIIERTEQGDILTANFRLADLENYISSKKTRSEQVLSDIIKKEKLLEVYDYIIIDTPPSLGDLTVNALVASHSVIIPIEPAELSISGLHLFLDTFSEIEKYYGVTLEGVLFTKTNCRTREFRKHWSYLSDIFKEKLYDFYIPIDQKIPESQSGDNFKDGKPRPSILAFPNSASSITYMKLVDSVMGRTTKV